MEQHLNSGRLHAVRLASAGPEQASRGSFALVEFERLLERVGRLVDAAGGGQDLGQVAEDVTPLRELIGLPADRNRLACEPLRISVLPARSVDERSFAQPPSRS
jgi:hypothetical protein